MIASRPLASLTGRLARDARELDAAATSLGWAAPGRTISVAGLHGGAGASTICLLLAHAIARFGRAPALAVDLAGRSRGGLDLLAGSSAAVVHDGDLGEAVGTGSAGVRILGAERDGVEELDDVCESLAARLARAVSDGHDDAGLGRLCRQAMDEHHAWQALRWKSGPEAFANLLGSTAEDHAVVAVDLGMLDSPALARTVVRRSSLHIWAVPSDPAALRVAERRLPVAGIEPQHREAIAVWARPGAPEPSSKRLSALGDLRGCPVVRVPDHGPGDDWAGRVLSCLAAVEELCDLAS